MEITVEEGQVIEVGVTPRRFRTVVIKGDPLYDGAVLLKISGERYMSLCWACNGSGYRPGYSFSDQSRCWPCGYTGVHKVIGRGTIEELVKALINRAKARARYAEKKRQETGVKQAAYVQWLEGQPEVSLIMETVESEPDLRWDATLRDLATRAGHMILSDAQVKLIGNLFREDLERQAVTSERRWLGSKGDKITVSGTLTFSDVYGGDYGLSTLYVVTTAEGNVVTWWRTGGFKDEPRGAKVTLKGTIKDLKDDRKYGKQTLLTRCNIEYAD